VGRMPCSAGGSGERCHVIWNLRRGIRSVIAGLIYGAHLLHVPAHWIAVGAIVLLGLGILSAVKATRQRDPS